MKAKKDYINLLPKDEKKKAARGGGRGALIALIFALAWAAACGWQGFLAWELKRQLTSLALQRQELLRQLNTIRAELGLTVPAGTGHENAALINTLLGERVLWSDVFKQFSRIVPKGLWFDNLEGNTGGRAEIRVKGGAFNYLSVAEFMLTMEKSGYFVSPQLLYAQKGVVQGQDVIGFEIVCGIKKGEAAR